MRSSNSIKNGIVTMIMYIVTILIGFIAQKIFIVTLGNEYLGINGLFNNVLSMLSIVELGFGSAIIYNLYKPIAENDIDKIKSLMQFYKVTYRIIAIIIAILGICILPFLKYIIGEVNIQENVHFLFILALIDVIVSYLLTYKRSILYASQKTYITNIVHIGYVIGMNALQIVFLYLTQNYVLYLMIKIVFRILENIIITIIANQKYPYIVEKSAEHIDIETKNDIVKKVKGLVFHKIGGIVVYGTDNIIISKFLGVVTVGLYSNYNLIINAVTTLFGQVFSSITATVGNLLIEENEEKSYQVYKKILLLNSWIYTFASSSILCLMEPFIEVWIGNEYILANFVLCVLVANFYIQGMRKTCSVFKEAAGIFHEDRFVPVVESIINIVASIIFVKIFGLAGVFMGTILSTSILFLYSYPVIVYKKLFDRTYMQYILEMAKYFIITAISVVLTGFVCNLIGIGNSILAIAINLILCLIIPNLIYYIIFKNTEEFKYYLQLIKNIVNKFKEKVKKH